MLEQGMSKTVVKVEDKNKDSNNEEATKQDILLPSTSSGRISPLEQFQKKKSLFSVESTSVHKRRLNQRLVNKLRMTVHEYGVNTGQQAIVLIMSPSTQTFNVYGSEPLRKIIEGCKVMVSNDLELASTSVQPPVEKDPSLFELPPITIRGFPKLLEHMTLANFRSFIPKIMKYSTGREKPGWGRECNRPPWWPDFLPWKNIIKDERSAEEKAKETFRSALTKAVINCYKFHNREDLLKTSIVKDDTHSNIPAPPNSRLDSEESIELNEMMSYKTSFVNDSSQDPLIVFDEADSLTHLQ